MTQGSKRPVHRRGRVLLGGVLAAGACAALVISRSPQEAPRVPAPVVPAAVGAAATRPAAPPQQQAPDVPLDYDEIRQRAQRTIRAALEETGSAVRAQGSAALGKMYDSMSVPALTALTESDPDDEVRGHAAEALGRMGAAVGPRLAKLELTAPPLLKVSYASTLARLGDPAAPGRLLEYARSKELAVSFKAGLALAEVSRPGDPAAIAALKALVAREAELGALAPHARTLLLSRLAALHDPNARKFLYALLEDRDEGARLAAAEGLAKLGDDAGRKVLQAVLADPASSSWLVAVLALIPLGEPGDPGQIAAKLADRSPGIRRLAARALGALGDRRGLPALLAHADDPDRTVRVEVAAAIVAVAGLDPRLLSQTSVDWVKHALVSPDGAARKAAARVLADLPEPIGLRLLAKASTDLDPGVRRVAAESAGKMRSAGAATVIAAAVKTERDPAVKEQQVRALGEIGSPATRDTLARIAAAPGRIGVLAGGSLLATGDPTGLAKLEAAIASPQVELRLAAVQAASASKNPIVIPTLKIGVRDRVFEIRFTAAEGLSFFRADEAAAVPVLTEGLESADAGVVGRALAALMRFGKTLVARVQRPADLLDSTDPHRRLATVPIVHALPPGDAVPLLRRLVVDLDRDVRHAGVEAIAGLAARAPAQAIELYKPLVDDVDPVVRAKASGQLARLLPPMGPPPDPLLAVKRAFDEAGVAAAEARSAAAAFEALAGDIAMKTAARAPEEAVLRQVQALGGKLDEAAARVATAAGKAELAAQTASDAAGASPSREAAKLVDQATVLAQGALDAASAARGKHAHLTEVIRICITVDVQVLLDGAAASMASGNLPGAQQRLDRAASLLGPSKSKHPRLDYLSAQLHDRMAARTQDPAAKRELLRQAAEAYQRFAKLGSGPRIALANDRAAEIATELEELGRR